MRQVSAEGSPSASIVIVGEAPGEFEDKTGRPFVGESGQQLSKYLESVGLTRSDCYITNVVKERPPRNSMVTFATGLVDKPSTHTKLARLAALGSLPTLDAYNIWESALYEELNACTANVIVPMGNWALWALTRRWGIDKWRGSQMEAVPALGGRKVIPTYHPAATLPGRDFYAQFPLKMDLRRIKEHMAFPERRTTDRNLFIFPDFNQAMSYMRSCLALREVGFDIEAMPRGGTKKQPETWEMSCFSLARDPMDAISIPIMGPEGLYWTEGEHVEIMLMLAQVLENADVVKVGQNLNFDTSFMLSKHGIECAPIYDTMIAQRIILPDLPAGLDFLTSVYTNEPYYKDDGKQWGDTKNWEQFYIYSAKDAAVTLEVAQRQLNDLSQGGHLATYHRTLREFPACAFMQQRGVRSDEPVIAKLRVEVQAELEARHADILERVHTHATTYKNDKGEDKPFDSKFANSPSQCKAYFYGTLGNKPYRLPRSQGGGITCNDEALQRLARKGVEEASLLLAYRERHTLMKAYLKARLDGGRFKAQWKPGNQDTGRSTSAKNIFGYGLNLTTIPREGNFKKMFLPDEGYLLVAMDMSQAEARILAHCGGVTAKVEAYRTGRDVYALTASRIAQRLGHDLSYDAIVEQHEGKVMAPIAGGKKSWRGWGKECDLALGYKMGPDRFSRRTEMPLSDAKTVHRAWHTVYPEVEHGYWAMIDKMIATNRTVINPFGRRRKFLGPKNDIQEPSYSHFCQSTVADAMKERALAPMMEEQEIFGPIELLLQVHDAVIWQVPLDVGLPFIADVIMALKNRMEKRIEWQGISFSIPTSVAVSTVSWGNAKEIGTGLITPDLIGAAIA